MTPRLVASFHATLAPKFLALDEDTVGFVAIHGGKGRLDLGIQRLAVGDAASIRRESLVAEQIGPPQYISAEALPFAVLLDGDYDVPSSLLLGGRRSVLR